MTGSLQIKSKKYYVVLDWYEDGKRKQKWIATGLDAKGNKRRAEMILEKELQELRRIQELGLIGEDQYFLEFMEQWLDEVQAFSIRPTTLEQYKAVFQNVISLYKPFGALTLRQLTARHIQSFYNSQMKRGVSESTLRKYHTNIRKCLQYALHLDIIERNPADRVILPKRQRKQCGTVYSAEQLQQLFALFEGDLLETLVRLTATYGLRRSEVLGLRWDAIDFEEKTISIHHTAVTSKSGVIYADTTKSPTSRRILPLTVAMEFQLLREKRRQEDCQAFLRDAYVNSGYVCVHEDGTPIPPNEMTMRFRRVLKKSELPYIRFHDLRHSCATLLHSVGRDLQDIQNWLGHSDISTTANVYSHFLYSAKQDMAESIDRALAF